MSPGPRLNRAPIVLVGGFTVWGRDEVFGLKYWGGPGRDVQEDLKAQGFETVTAAPGPFSSNWDRAAEVYALLKGGRVDYGKAHAARCGHARFGRTCPGLLPALGTPEQPRAHLVGHSMGGQTIRVLAHLLAEGDEEERRASPGDLSPLFQGGRDWALSLTSIATPHDGSSLTRKREGVLGTARRLLALQSGLYGASAVYDLKLDPWGLQRAAGEKVGGLPQPHPGQPPLAGHRGLQRRRPRPGGRPGPERLGPPPGRDLRLLLVRPQDPPRRLRPAPARPPHELALAARGPLHGRPPARAAGPGAPGPVLVPQ